LGVITPETTRIRANGLEGEHHPHDAAETGEREQTEVRLLSDPADERGTQRRARHDVQAEKSETGEGEVREFIHGSVLRGANRWCVRRAAQTGRP
jgi:hypothetical protein